METSIPSPRWPSRLIAAALLIDGLFFPAFLSVFFIHNFEFPGESPDHWFSPYPWQFPAWSYSITFLKMAALVAWLVPRARWLARRPWLVGAFSGIFFIGGLHAAMCTLYNLMGFMGDLTTSTCVCMAGFSALLYLTCFVLAALWVIRLKARPQLGFTIGMSIAILLPGLAELAISGSKGIVYLARCLSLHN